MARIENHTISPLKKLIDVNGQLTNFKVEFMVRCKNEIKPFKIALVDQTILDNGEKINWKLVSDGGLKGGYVYDKGVFTNHYIYLKSDEQVNVEVRLNVMPLEEENPKQTSQEPPKCMENFATDETSNHKKVDKPFYKSWFFIGFCIVLVIGIMFYLWYPCKTDEKKEDEKKEDEDSMDNLDTEKKKADISLEDFISESRKEINNTNEARNSSKKSSKDSRASSKESSRASSKAPSNKSSPSVSRSGSPDGDKSDGDKSPEIDFRTKGSSRDRKRVSDYNFGF